MVILTVVHEMTMVSLKSNENFLNMTIVSLFVRISLSYIFSKRFRESGENQIRVKYNQSRDNQQKILYLFSYGWCMGVI